MADPGRATGADSDAESRGSVRQATLLVVRLACIAWKRPRANALKRSAAPEMPA